MPPKAQLQFTITHPITISLNKRFLCFRDKKIFPKAPYQHFLMLFVAQVYTRLKYYKKCSIRWLGQTYTTFQKLWKYLEPEH